MPVFAASRADSHIGTTDLGAVALVREAIAVAILVILTLTFQCAGLGALIYWGSARFARFPYRLGPFRSAALMVRFTSIIVTLHGLQILLWACFYRWNCFLSWEFSLYFSTASYSTVGAGDLLLPGRWRILGAVESVTGVLMCGFSASFIFAVTTRLVELEARFLPKLAWRTSQLASPEGALDPGPRDQP